MEILNQNTNDSEAYRIALEKVKKIKKFYVHLIIYTLVNAIFLFIIYKDLDANDCFFSFKTFSLVFYWGIGLVAHGFSVFVPLFVFGKGWEDKKVKQFMNKDKHTNWE